MMRNAESVAVKSTLQPDERLDCRWKTAGSAVQGEGRERQQREPGGEDQFVDVARAPEAAEEQEGGGERRLIAAVVSSATWSAGAWNEEIEALDEDERDRRARRNPARSQPPASSAAAQRLSFTPRGA